MQDTSFKYQINADEVFTCLDRQDNSDYLGQGSYGKVQRVYTKKFGVSAAKIFHLTGTVGRHSSSIDLVKKEADTLALASHENIVRFQAVCHWPSYVAIIMQYEVNGNMHTLLQDKDRVSELPYKLRFRMAHEVTKALVFLHNLETGDRVIHGDLKSSNILLNEDLRVRVADFGAAEIGTKTCDQTRQRRRSEDSLVHSVVFTAPEFLNDIYSRRKTAMDVFSFGRLIYQLLTRTIPYSPNHRRSNISGDIVNGEEPDYSRIPEIRQTAVNNLNDDLRLFDYLTNCMEKCCNRNPEARPKMPEVEKEMKEILNTVSSVTMLKTAAFVLNQMAKPKPESREDLRVSLGRYNRQ